MAVVSGATELVFMLSPVNLPACTNMGLLQPEAKNRILRRYPNHTEYFLRVQFQDEDGRELRFNAKVDNERIYKRFRDVLTNGIAIAGRMYSCLGWSHSSLRSHSAWCIAPFVYDGRLQTHKTIKESLGNFGSIPSPARCAARIGQAFSETPFAISLEENGIIYREIPDIYSEDGNRIFSDGVGTISRGVVQAIADALPSRKLEPTCYQIRWGGAKGMVALDTELSGNVIRIRPSMIKFDANDRADLEICDMANKPIPLVLNRQMIKILEDLAVSSEWFFKHQDRELRRLRQITATTPNTATYLKRQKVADKVGLPQLIRRLDGMGLDYKRDRFLGSVVEVTVLRELRLLKHKARIPIENGVTLFGICDETGFLEENEIFVTFDSGFPFVREHALDLGDMKMIVTR